MNGADNGQSATHSALVEASIRATPRSVKGHLARWQWGIALGLMLLEPSLLSAAPRRRSRAVFPVDATQTVAYEYAQLDEAACHERLEARGLPVRRNDQSVPGVKAPVRLTGALHGVTFRTDLAVKDRETSPYEIFDCRLVLALDDFSKLLEKEGIVEAVYSSAYRPPPKSRKNVEQGKRHEGGLAIDIHRFRKSDGTVLKVDRDFRGRIGSPVCGKRAQPQKWQKPEAQLLRRLVCTAAEQHLFQSILTPNADRPHRTHFHLEVTPGVRWFIVS